MSMRDTNERRTICEVLREINDVVTDPVLRIKLAEVENMAKRMMLKLLEYNKDVDKDWWEANSDYEADLKRRMQ